MRRLRHSAQREPHPPRRTRHRAARHRHAPRSQRPGSHLDRRRPRTQHARLGQRDARISVPAMAGGSASREIESRVSARRRQNRNVAVARRRRCLRARVAAQRRARLAIDSSRRRADESHHVRSHVAASVGVLLGRRCRHAQSVARAVSRWLLHRVRRRRLLRIAQRIDGRSLACFACVAGRRTESAERRRFARASAGALQRSLEHAGGDVRIRHPADLRRSASFGFRRARESSRRARRTFSGARTSRPAARRRIFSACAGNGSARHAASSAGSDRPGRAISHRPVSRDFRRQHGRREDRVGLRARARSGDGPPRPRLAPHETVLRRRDAARRRLLPQESPRRCRRFRCSAPTAFSIRARSA